MEDRKYMMYLRGIQAVLYAIIFLEIVGISLKIFKVVG